MSATPTHWIHWKSRVDVATRRCTIAWAQEFGNANPVDIEIGAGNGLWLRTYGAENPARNVIGIELVGTFVRESNRRTLRDKQENIRHMAGDARMILALAFPDCSVGRAFVNFPDPWFKKRHKKRRLLNQPFLRMLSRKLVIGGDVVVATDDREYCDFTRESFAEVPEFTPAFAGTHMEELPGYPQTKYEKKWRGMGRGIHYMRYVNARNADIDDDVYFREQQLAYGLSLLGIPFESGATDQEISDDTQDAAIGQNAEHAGE